jgi:hypothetical protein
VDAKVRIVARRDRFDKRSVLVCSPRLHETLARVFDALEAACADVRLPAQDRC